MLGAGGSQAAPGLVWLLHAGQLGLWGRMCFSKDGTRSTELLSSVCPHSAQCLCQEGLNGSVGSISPDGILSTEMVLHFQGDRKPFFYGCECPVISIPPWLQGPAGALACPAVTRAEPLYWLRRRETEARRVWGSITESCLEGLCLHYPWDLGRDKVLGTSCF